MINNEEVWPLWALTVGVALPLVAVLLACICCRKTMPKNELLGLAGMVKITNPEENLNHNENSNEIDACTVIGSGVSCADTTESNKRASTTANRSLPDIPIDSERIRLESGDTLWESNEPNGDTSSELYATVEENKHTAQPLVSTSRPTSRATKKRSIQDGPTDESKSSEHSSLSQTDDSFSPYARLKAEHPYDKLRSEHPYAQVGASNELDSAIYDLSQIYGKRTSLQSEDSQSLRRSTSGENTSSSQGGTSGNPIPPPRTRKSSSHNSLLLAPTATLLPGSVPDIQAATAIAGHITANQELPYMTPPIPASEIEPLQQPQPNFSGDSQDSKGYTSISVREPLANIKAQTKVANQRSRTQELVDSHYATVSDDSDEMYAAIEEPGQVYTSGSETYAQIQPLAVLEAASEAAADESHYPPQPPSVDSLKQVAQVHSRQASSSSAASSVANLGSPKPEKRQANSPLPPPPAGSPDLYAAVEKKSTGLAVNRNLEEMYAKVMKKKQRAISVDTHTQEPSDNLSHTSVTSMETSSSQGSPELRTQQEADVISACSLEHEHDTASNKHDPGYEKVHGSPLQNFLLTPDVVEPSYESLGGPSSFGTSYHDPGYEVVQRHPSDCDPNYEELRPQPRNSTDSENIGHINRSIRTSQIVTDKTDISGNMSEIPGYEQVHSGLGVTRDVESMSHYLERLHPGYEQVRPAIPEVNYASVNKNRGVGAGNRNSTSNDVWAVRPDPGYEQVGSQNGCGVEKSDVDPGYEQVNRETKCNGRPSIMGYVRVRSRGSSDGDTCSGAEPDYATVDRNREQSDDTGEPNYESMSSEGQDVTSGIADDPNYESVSYFDMCDPPYERLHNETRDSDDASSGYEKVKDREDPSSNDVDNKQLASSNPEPGYEEVGRKWDVMNGGSDVQCNSLSSNESNRQKDLPISPQTQTNPTNM